MIRRVKWNYFFREKIIVNSVKLFAAGHCSFEQFRENCSKATYSATIKFYIGLLEKQGYDKAKLSAHNALIYRGHYRYKNELEFQVTKRLLLTSRLWELNIDKWKDEVKAHNIVAGDIKKILKDKM